MEIILVPAITEGDHRSSSPLPEDSDLRQSLTPSEASSADIPAGSQLLVEDVNLEEALEVMPELHNHADTILTHIATNVSDLRALRAELEDDTSRDHKRVERYYTYLIKAMEALGSGDGAYVPVSRIQSLLETPRYNEVMYEANIAVLARWCGTVDRDHETTMQSLMELDRIFPKYFVAGGDESTFEAGLEIRTQALIVTMERQSKDEGRPQIAGYINHFFGNEENGLKSWDGLMFSGWKPAVVQRIQDITQLLGGSEDIDALKEHYEWEDFLTFVHGWIRGVNADKERIARVSQSLPLGNHHVPNSPPLTAPQPQPQPQPDAR